MAMSLTDRKGDTLNYPKVVLGLPFSETGSTGGGQYSDDYSVACGAADADSGGSPVGGGDGVPCWLLSANPCHDFAGAPLSLPACLIAPSPARLPCPPSPAGCGLLLPPLCRLHHHRLPLRLQRTGGHL
jgi:hypothetical protein